MDNQTTEDGDGGHWEGDFYVVPRTWPITKANWRRLKLAFAGCFHAWADSIEISDHDQNMKDQPHV